MEKLPMCRLCLAENVRMYVVVNKDLHELYKRLTDHPFVTGDSRPMLACFICCTKLKQCCQLQRKCLEAEKLFTQMMNEDCEHNPLANQDQFGCFNGFIQSPMVHVSIESDDECQTECDAIKEEFSAVWERLDDVIEPEEEHQSDDLELENLYSSHSDAEVIPAQQSESDSEDYVPLIKIKTEVEEEEVSRKKRRASDTTRAPVANNSRLQTRKSKLEDVITEEVKKTKQSDTKDFRTTENCTYKPDPGSEKPPTFRKNCIKKYNKEFIKCKLTNKGIESDNINEICQSRVNKKRNLTSHIRTHTDEKPFKCEICQSCFRRKANLTLHIRTHTGEKPFKCDICQSFFRRKGHLTSHIRTHTGEKPFKCEICLHRCVNKGGLTRHVRKHTGQKPFKCEVCQRRFNEKSDLTKHIRTHTGEKPFKCDICQRCFSIKNLLTNHTRIHTGAKPFKCDICQRCFRSKGNLKSHLRTHDTVRH